MTVQSNQTELLHNNPTNTLQMRKLCQAVRKLPTVMRPHLCAVMYHVTCRYGNGSNGAKNSSPLMSP